MSRVTSTLPSGQVARARLGGKFIFVGEEKFYVRGVTYGAFRPDESGCEFGGPETVERDFTEMAANGINAVRTYTVPHRWLLDLAQQHELRVMVGIPWSGSVNLPCCSFSIQHC